VAPNLTKKGNEWKLTNNVLNANVEKMKNVANVLAEILRALTVATLTLEVKTHTHLAIRHRQVTAEAVLVATK
jgi:hypothetical protein